LTAYTYQFFIDNPDVFKSINIAAPVKMKCNQCQKNYVREKRFIYAAVKKWKSKRNFCSKECDSANRIARGSVVEPCVNCGVDVVRMKSQRRRSKNIFCGSSCLGTYVNTHKTHGTRRSKLESYVEEFLRTNYPDLEIVCNSKTAIESELDFYFPQLRLAIEFNGPTHYRPIYGQKKFEQIQINDRKKIDRCAEAGIDLKIVDSSEMDHLNDKWRVHFSELVKSQIESSLKA
jgi:hypothetical protein